MGLDAHRAPPSVRPAGACRWRADEQHTPAGVTGCRGTRPRLWGVVRSVAVAAGEDEADQLTTAAHADLVGVHLSGVEHGHRALPGLLDGASTRCRAGGVHVPSST